MYGLRPLCGFSPPHLGQGSLLRNTLLPATNVSYSPNVRRNIFEMYKNMQVIVDK
jgi:hypothetical protein